MVAALGFDTEEGVLRGEEVVFQFAECLEYAACFRLEGTLGFAEDFLWRRGQGCAAHIVEIAEELQGRD